MTREELIRCYFSRRMHLLEIGPSYSPILPKAEGWQTTVVDHASQAELVAKYAAMGVATVNRIEPVDFIWQDGPLTTLIPQAMHGSYDGLVASHVGEHLPDLIAFFRDASALMKPDGVMALALPDKRVCFDFFQPLTTTGDLVAAHVEGRTRHQRRTFFNQAAYFVTRNNEVGWAHTGNTAPLVLAHPLSLAQHGFDTADESPASDYRDSHAWAFTPKSFELLILELNLLGHINWAVRSIEAASGVEFYVWLEQARLAMPEDTINPRRLSLLTAMVYETMDAIAQLNETPIPPSVPTPDQVAARGTAHQAAMLVDDPNATAAALDEAILLMQRNDNLPGLLGCALDHYGAALSKGDEANSEVAWDKVVLLARHSGNATPRLLNHALGRYKAALLKGGKASISKARKETAEMVALLPDKRRLHTTLNLLRNPTLAKSAFALRRFVRPAMLWAFR